MEADQPRPRILPAEARAAIIADYLNDVPVSLMTKLYRVDKSTITRIVKQEGIPFRGKTYQSRKHVHPNEAAFATLNEASLYWMGWMASDGWVRQVGQRQWRLALKLNKRDGALVERFAAFLGVEAQTRGIYSEVSVSSIELCKALEQQGIVPRKTYALTVSQDLATSRHFWRGVFEGDGSAFIYTDNCKRGPVGGYRRPKMTLTSGSTDFLKQFQEFLLAQLAIETRITGWTRSATTFHVQITGWKVCKIMALLYDGSAPDLRLERKYEIAREIMGLGIDHGKAH